MELVSGMEKIQKERMLLLESLEWVEPTNAAHPKISHKSKKQKGHIGYVPVTKNWLKWSEAILSPKASNRFWFLSKVGKISWKEPALIWKQYSILAWI